MNILDGRYLLSAFTLLSSETEEVLADWNFAPASEWPGLCCNTRRCMCLLLLSTGRPDVLIPATQSHPSRREIVPSTCLQALYPEVVSLLMKNLVLEVKNSQTFNLRVKALKG